MNTLVLRGHWEAQPPRKKRGKEARSGKHGKKKKSLPRKRPATWSPFALVLDCETRIDQNQSLTFGFFRILESAHGAYGNVREEGVFYDPDELSTSEIETIKSFRERAEVASDVHRHKVVLLTKQQFIEEYFFPHAEAGSLIVGFNLPYDITRLPSDARPATRVDKDWSLVFSNRSANPDQLYKRQFRIKIDRKDSKIAFMSLSGRFVDRGRFASTGRFLDLLALAFAFSNTIFKLKSLAKQLKKKGFKVPQKMGDGATGLVTREEMLYCRQDVRVTAGVLNALRHEFDLHPDLEGRLLPEDAVSPASILKTYVEAMGISFPQEKYRLPRRIQGIACQAYYGGKSQVTIRHAQVPVVHTDFVSQYPTTILLMNLWPFLTAKRLDITDASQRVKTLLTRVTKNPEIVFDQRFWKSLCGYALVEPHDDILPIRTDYDENKPGSNIGLNILEQSDYPLWYALPDLVASTLFTGKAPKILKAIGIVPVGTQKRLRPISLRGREQVDPVSGNLFRTLIEAKERVRASDPEQAYFLKIMANAGYGIFIETTPRRVSKAVKTKVYSGEFLDKKKFDVIEDKGKFYCPVISSLITAGGRLLLALLEKEVADAGGSALFCDTDSLAFTSAKQERWVRVSDPEAEKQQFVKALSWKTAAKIIDTFRKLNPYDFSGSILKVEKRSLTRQLYGYAVSAKRYVLFDEHYNIVHASSHGLGHLFVPKAKWNKKIEAPYWVGEAWRYLLGADPGKKLSRLFSTPAMMRVAMTTPKVKIWKALDKKQRDLLYKNRIKPSNFVLMPLLKRKSGEHSIGLPKGVNPEKFMLVTPFSSERSDWYRLKYIDVDSSKEYRLAPLRRKMDTDASPLTLEDIVGTHLLHPEAKSLAPDGGSCGPRTRGLLQRARIVAEGPPILIGKETDRRGEKDEDPSIFEPIPTEFRWAQRAKIRSDVRLRRKLRDCGYTFRQIATKSGLDLSTVQNAMKAKPIRKTSADKLWGLLKTHPTKPRK
jgi:hypothetical protein